MGKTVIFLHELGTEIKNMNKGKYAMEIQSYLHLLLNTILLPISCQPLIFSRPRPLSHHTSSVSFINFIISQLSHEIWRAFHRHQITSTPQPYAPTALREILARTLTRSAARTITSVMRWHQSKVWSNSSSGIGPASTPASCTNR